MQTPSGNIDASDNAIQLDKDISSHLQRLNMVPHSPYIPILGTEDRRTLAAIQLQKVYKSFRTRRRLADCAVLAEHKWWQVLDLAKLKHSTISFFDIGKPESAISRWSRARTKAAKVGKGSSKDALSRKLALQHWLEAIDPRHRYGHNLQFYYVRWLHCESNQPFFYWLDIGDGREVNLIERCPRARLLQQCIKYLDQGEREQYEVIVENGRLIYKKSRKAIDTIRGPRGAKCIFVLSTTNTLYVGQKIKGKFQHSSFLAGGATLSAGRLEVDDGNLLSVSPHSGHYLPTEENYQAFISFLRKNNVDLTTVKKAVLDKDGVNETPSFHTNLLSKDEQNNSPKDDDQARQEGSKLSEAPNSTVPKRSHLIRSKIEKLRIPSMRVEEDFKTPQPQLPPPESLDYNNESDDGFETAEDSLLSENDFMYTKLNLFEVHEDPKFEEKISKSTIRKRIRSHRRTRSYQLGEHLQFKWTTGAGPRIGCVRDYPSKLQFQVLEQVHLSPRCNRYRPSPFETGVRQEITPSGSNLYPDINL